MSIGPPPTLGGSLTVDPCNLICTRQCDPKYFPRCTNDCEERRRCCREGDGDGDGDGDGCTGSSCKCGEDEIKYYVFGLSPSQASGWSQALERLPGEPCSTELPHPNSIPSSGTSQRVKVNSTQVRELPVTCDETGETQFSTCGWLTFFHDAGGTKHYSTPGGVGYLCTSDPNPHNCSAGSASNPTPFDVTITVTVS